MPRRITSITDIPKVYKSPIQSAETLELQGYEFITSLFVDSSGFGQEDEQALTVNQF